MKTDQLEGRVLACLARVAPEAQLDHLDQEVNLQDQLDLDSVDMMNYIMNLQVEFKITIPGQDYKKFLTIADTIQWLAGRL